MGKDSGQNCGDKYHERLVRYFSDGNNTVQICQSRAEKTEADYLRAHRRANNISSKANRERGDNRI